MEQNWTLTERANNPSQEILTMAPEGSETPRSKTSLRMHYEAQIQVLKNQVGDLEDIRGRLGLTQRKISQLLMVDPSAWTRWTKGSKDKDQAPPHVYRALHWYLILQEKIPGLTPQYFIGKDPEVLHQSALREIREESEARKSLEQRILKTQQGQLSELRSQNEVLTQDKELLEARISELENQVRANRAGFYLLVLAFLILGASLYWFSRR